MTKVLEGRSRGARWCGGDRMGRPEQPGSSPRFSRHLPEKGRGWGVYVLKVGVSVTEGHILTGAPSQVRTSEKALTIAVCSVVRTALKRHMPYKSAPYRPTPAESPRTLM